MDIQSYLPKIFLFESLTNEQVELIANSTSFKRIEKGESLFFESQPATAFFFVVSGSVKIYKLSAEGSEQILHIQKPGDLVAEAIIFEFETYPAFCQALEDTELIRFSRTEFLKALHHFPEISFKIMGAYSRRLRQLVAKIEDLSLHDVKARLANYLLANCTFKDNRWTLSLTLTKKDLASVIGTIPETISRTLHYFKKEKIIFEEKDVIIILNKAKLKSIGK
jgi:CRP/FNR family transcriptional regulator